VFADPSIVNGDVPVSNSYVSTPSDHQSTACWHSNNSLTQNHVLSCQWLSAATLYLWPCLIFASPKS